MTFAEFAVVEPGVAAWAATEVPPTRPERAAVRSSAFSWFFIDFDLVWGLGRKGSAGCGVAELTRRNSALSCHATVRVSIQQKGYIGICSKTNKFLAVPSSRIVAL